MIWIKTVNGGCINTSYHVLLGVFPSFKYKKWEHKFILWTNSVVKQVYIWKHMLSTIYI